MLTQVSASCTVDGIFISLALRLRVLAFQQIHHLFAPIVQPFQLARRAFRESVGRDQRQGHCRVEVTDHRARQLIGIDLAPTDRLGRRCAGKSARVGPGVREL